MTQQTVLHKTRLYTIILCASMAIMVSCSTKKEKQAEVIKEVKPNTEIVNPMKDSMSRQTLTHQPSAIPIPPRNEPSRPKELEVIIPLKPKICDINLKLIASPKNGQKIYYVTGLIPGEFKCWVDLENASLKICNGSPSVLYFVDIPNPKVTPTPPHFLDASTLATNGVGLFEYNGSNWTMRGAGIWKRKDKGYGYYNTDNAGGG
ncbi:MAG: hypothetical protein IPP15_04180 [Saprospiraceae bacterium]|uniref:Uncharacterized protein n=1 Tax=Candidatus Opimibacter skivensis TaxID=2982028 RepID=A0A9D7XSE0_9BACT|nr:hypothetical protein [Candidatus Opimibacter skivensis]